MKPELQAALERRGWDGLYSDLIPDLGPVTPRGERRAKSPFPDSSDSNPSFSVNVINGLWKCWSSDRAGDYVLFVALMEAEEFDDSGRAIPNYGKAERKLLIEHGISHPVDPAWVEECKRELYQDLATQTQLQRSKPWTREAMWHYGVGYDHRTERFTIPSVDQWGQLVNVLLYQPGGQPKVYWKAQHIAANIVFPHQAWREQHLILVEGVTDVLSLRSLGFHACSGVMGAGQPVPEGTWFHGKQVYLWFDNDTRGQAAISVAIRELATAAAEIYVVPNPELPDQPVKDASDYIQALLAQGLTPVEVSQNIVNLLQRASAANVVDSRYDQEARATHFSESLTSDHLGSRISFQARALARANTRYTVPTRVNLRCPAHGHSYCRRCPMSFQFQGNNTFRHEVRSQDTLKLIQVSEEQRNKTLLRNFHVPDQCPDVRVSVEQAVDLEPVMFGLAPHEHTELETAVDRQRREAYVICRQGLIQENTDYSLNCWVYPHPKTQQLTLIVDSYEASESLLNYQQPDLSVVCQAAQVFAPKGSQSVLEKLTDVAEDMALSVTQIFDRADLHLAYRTVWYSSLAFNFLGAFYHRGWVEALVIGDTRCGKSQAFKAMANWFGRGELIDCKLQTPAGILGAVIQAASGEYYVTPGIMPQNDGGIVCFDEFHVPKWQGGTTLLDHLSSTRAEGVVRVSKAASATFPARVRSIWLANPGGGRLLRDLADSGVETIPKLINQPEDIARFDIALTVSQDDVSDKIINSKQLLKGAKYPRDLARELLRWAYTRSPDQIHWADDSEQVVLDVTQCLCQVYDPAIPLVEASDQRHRVAKLAVSVAAQCASASADYQHLLVKPEHVHAVEELLHIWYDKPTMGYDVFSKKVKIEDNEFDPVVPLEVFNESLKPHGRRMALELLRLDQFSERSFTSIVPQQVAFAKGLIQRLYLANCIRLVHRGRSEFYEKTPQFNRFLKEYLGM